MMSRSGNRSAQAARTQTDALGVRGVDVFNVEGGMVALLGAGLPAVGGDGTPGAVA